MSGRSALEQEFIARIGSVAFWLRRRDRGVLLGAGLCFAPFPPVFLLGLSLTVMNLALVRRGSLPKCEVGLLCTAIVAALAFSAIWGVLVLWVVRSGGWFELGAAVRSAELWLLHLLQPGIRLVPRPAVHQV